MDYGEIRAFLTEHFRSLLAKQRGEIDKVGRLDQLSRDAVQNSVAVAQDALTDGWLPLADEYDDAFMDRLI